MFIDNRNHALIDKPAHRIAHHPLFVTQQIIDPIKVDTFEWHQSPPDSFFPSLKRRGDAPSVAKAQPGWSSRRNVVAKWLRPVGLTPRGATPPLQGGETSVRPLKEAIIPA